MRSRLLFIPGLQSRRGKYALVLASVSGRNVGRGSRVADPLRLPSASPAQRVEMVLELEVVGGAAPLDPPYAEWTNGSVFHKAPPTREGQNCAGAPSARAGRLAGKMAAEALASGAAEKRAGGVPSVQLRASAGP